MGFALMAAIAACCLYACGAIAYLVGFAAGRRYEASEGRDRTGRSHRTRADG